MRRCNTRRASRAKMCVFVLVWMEAGLSFALEFLRVRTTEHTYGGESKGAKRCDHRSSTPGLVPCRLELGDSSGSRSRDAAVCKTEHAWETRKDEAVENSRNDNDGDVSHALRPNGQSAAGGGWR